VKYVASHIICQKYENASQGQERLNFQIFTSLRKLLSAFDDFIFYTRFCADDMFSFNARTGHYDDRYISGNNSPASRELFKPFTDLGSLLVSIKNILSFGFDVFWGDVINGVALAFFGRGHLVLGPNPTSHFWLKCFLDTRLQFLSLEPLIGFLAYLEPQPWFKSVAVRI